MTSLVLITTVIILAVITQQNVYAWPAGTTEAQKDKILSVTSDDQLSLEEVSISEERVYEIFDFYTPGTKEYQDVLDCGFVDKLGWEILQCLEKKGHPVK